MFRVGFQNADVLGLNSPTADGTAAVSDHLDENLVWDTLRTCLDPEIPVNIVDLGLVYDMQLVPPDGNSRVDVTMTLTAPGCGLVPAIANDDQV